MITDTVTPGFPYGLAVILGLLLFIWIITGG